jgi:site-specific recombinase XerC
MPSFRALADEYLAHRVAQRTLAPMTARNHRTHLAGFIRAVGDLPVGELSSADVEAWLETIGHLEASSRRSNFSSVKTFCTWLVRTDQLLRNPALEVDPPKVPRKAARALPHDSIAKLFAVLPDRRALVICGFMYGMGMRCAETSSAALPNWDRRAQTMHVTGKGSHERVLSVPREVDAAVDAYFAEEYPGGHGPIIRSYRHPEKGLTPDTLSGMVSEWCRAAGIKHFARDGVSAHALRATAATEMLEASENDTQVVQEFLGHLNLATTDIYLKRPELARMRSAMNRRVLWRRRQGSLFEVIPGGKSEVDEGCG